MFLQEEMKRYKTSIGMSPDDSVQVFLMYQRKYFQTYIIWHCTDRGDSFCNCVVFVLVRVLYPSRRCSNIWDTLMFCCYVLDNSFFVEFDHACHAPKWFRDKIKQCKHRIKDCTECCIPLIIVILNMSRYYRVVST